MGSLKVRGITQAGFGFLAMLKRVSSLALAILLGGSVLVGAAKIRGEHACEMAGMEMMPGMDTMPCCKDEQPGAVVIKSAKEGFCCVTIPRAPGSKGISFRLPSPDFGIANVHPAVSQSPLVPPKTFESYSNEVCLPDLQGSYILNHSLLI